jgi:hypothetical protein
MIMADVLTWFFLIVGILIVYNCYWLAARALFPGLVARCQAAYKRPFRITGFGLAVGAPVIAIAIGLMAVNNPAIKLIGGLVLSLPVFAGLAGSAGLAQRIGAGLPSAADAGQPWRQVLRGGPVLAFLCLLPLLGWFLLQPWILLSGIGALVTSVTPARKSAEAVQPAAALGEVRPTTP